MCPGTWCSQEAPASATGAGWGLFCLATPCLLPRALVLTKTNPTLTLLVFHGSEATLGGLGRIIFQDQAMIAGLPFRVGLQNLHARVLACLSKSGVFKGLVGRSWL